GGHGDGGEHVLPSQLVDRMTTPVKGGTLTTHGSNIGDDFIRDGALYLLQEALGAPAAAIRVLRNHPATALARPPAADSRLNSRIRPRPDWRGRHGLRAGSRLERADVVVHAGGPFLWWDDRRFGSRYVRSEWASTLYRDGQLIRPETPLLLLGIGTSVSDA